MTDAFDIPQHASRAGAGKQGAAVAVPLLLFLTGCAPTPGLVRSRPPARQEIVALVTAPLTAEENLRSTLVEHGSNMSLFVVQIRDRELPHIHTRYDLLVTMVRGKGRLWIHGRPVAMKAGDAAFLSRGTPHFFVNEGAEPALALVAFSPRFEGPDQQPVEEPGTGK